MVVLAEGPEVKECSPELCSAGSVIKYYLKFATLTTYSHHTICHEVKETSPRVAPFDVLTFNGVITSLSKMQDTMRLQKTGQRQHRRTGGYKSTHAVERTYIRAETRRPFRRRAIKTYDIKSGHVRAKVDNGRVTA